MKNKIFIPMYIDKVKLFDLNSILFGGFSEFNEISVSTDNNNSSEVKANSCFNLFKLSLGADTGVTEIDNQKITNNAKFIQTSSSMLSNILDNMNDGTIKNDVEKCKTGDFINMKLTFNLNSILQYLIKLKKILSFAEQVSKLDKVSNNSNNGNMQSKNNSIKVNKNNIFKDEFVILDNLITILDNNDGIIELVCESSTCIYVAYLNTDYLYHTQIERICNHSLNYFAQIMDIKDDYDFCRDTVLAGINKVHFEDFFNCLKSINKEKLLYDDINLITSNKGKKVIILDVISISRDNI